MNWPIIRVGFGIMACAFLWVIGAFTVAAWNDFALSIRWAVPCIPIIVIGGIVAVVGTHMKERR